MHETCSCGAKLEIPEVKEWAMEALVETFKAWRDGHRHEFAPVGAEGLLIHESGSSHERADLIEPSGTLPIGFNSW